MSDPRPSSSKRARSAGEEAVDAATIAASVPTKASKPEPPRSDASLSAAALKHQNHMPRAFQEQLGAGAFATPDEAADIENIVFGHVEYEDLPAERKAQLATVVRSLIKKFEQHDGGELSVKEAEKLYFKAARQVSSGGVARKSELIGAYRLLVRNAEVVPSRRLEDALMKKRGKSHSGVLVVTVLMGPGEFSCPKNCHYCPDQPGIARSYLLREPGVLRGFRNKWDPVLQFYDRASALENNGHVVDKIELLILGGTFSFYPKEYQEQFIGGLFYAANTYFDAAPVRAMLPTAEEITVNETAKCRIIGLTTETRPDYITRAELKRFRALGVTRVQIGIQHLDDNVLDVVNRECPTAKTVVAVQRLLDAGFKVDAHWMPDLPGSSFEKDMEMFKHLLSADNVAFQVDQWKVYPTMTVPFTQIQKWHEQGLYRPYAEQEGGKLMVDLLKYILVNVPYRLRLNRIVRDIPNTYITGGESRVNLRQLLDIQMKKEGLVCRDIRERECKGAPIQEGDAEMFIDEFRASHGTEFYVSIENRGRTQLYGHLRLRLRDDSSGSILPALNGAALIRELHTYGKLVAVSHGNTGQETQHVGVGTRLMRKAEEIAVERGFARAAVIAGVGVRGYYAKLGYELQETYMVKALAGPSMWRRFKKFVGM
jgi:ELP3 family radical SAM enzyme/protein acetyltransferase